MNNGFCTDLISLFFNHIWSCDECFYKVSTSLIGVFSVVALLTICLVIFCEIMFNVLNRLMLRKSYKAKYEALKEELNNFKNN